MKYKLWPPEISVKYVEIDENNKASLHYASFVKGSGDGETMPSLETEVVLLSSTSPNEICEEINNRFDLRVRSLKPMND